MSLWCYQTVRARWVKESCSRAKGWKKMEQRERESYIERIKFVHVQKCTRTHSIFRNLLWENQFRKCTENDLKTKWLHITRIELFITLICMKWMTCINTVNIHGSEWHENVASEPNCEYMYILCSMPSSF